MGQVTIFEIRLYLLVITFCKWKEAIFLTTKIQNADDTAANNVKRRFYKLVLYLISALIKKFSSHLCIMKIRNDVDSDQDAISTDKDVCYICKH